jgi:hypothetical protein
MPPSQKLSVIKPQSTHGKAVAPPGGGAQSASTLDIPGLIARCYLEAAEIPRLELNSCEKQYSIRNNV